MAQTNYTPYIIGGSLIAAVLLLKSKSTATAATVAPGASSFANQSTGVFVDATGHTVSIQPTAAQNAGLTDPNYQLSPAELAAYNANYLDLQQGMADWIPKYGTLNKALQAHWTQAGAAEHRTFLPLIVKGTQAYVPPPKDSGGWLSSALSIATAVIPLIAGPNQIQNLTGRDIETIYTGSAMVLDILPMFQDDRSYDIIENKVYQVLNSLANGS